MRTPLPGLTNTYCSARAWRCRSENSPPSSQGFSCACYSRLPKCENTGNWPMGRRVGGGDGISTDRRASTEALRSLDSPVTGPQPLRMKVRGIVWPRRGQKCPQRPAVESGRLWTTFATHAQHEYGRKKRRSTADTTAEDFNRRY